jgi:hypothetical protein
MPKNRTEGKVCMRDLLKGSPDEMDSIILTFSKSAFPYVFDPLDLNKGVL